MIGDCDNYNGINQDDLQQLKKALKQFHDAQLPVVLTMLSLPGSGWLQNNGDKDDLKIWKDHKYQE